TALIDADDSIDFNLAASYFNWRFRDQGWPWLEGLLADEALSARQRARLLLATDEYPAAWERLDDETVAREFWREFRVHGLGLEWAYLPAFEFEPAPPTLSRYLATNPSFFVDVVSRVFRPGDEEEVGERADDEERSGEQTDEPDEQEVEIARNGYRLLSEWRTL